MIWLWFIWSWTFHWINTEDTLSLMKTKIFRLFSSQQLILWLKRHILCHFRLLFSATGPRIMNTYSKMASALILYYSLGVQIINFALLGIFSDENGLFWTNFKQKFIFSSWNCIKNSFLVENVYFSKTSLLRVKILKSIWVVWPRASGNFQIEAILEYIDISDSVFTFVLDILTVADGCQLIYNFGNISIITSYYLCIWKQYTDVCTDTIRQ